MRRVRRALVLLTASWLMTQAALLAAPSVTLLTAAHDEGATECSCTHGENGICPMHHRPAPGTKICLIGSVDNTLATLGSFFHAPGLIRTKTAAPTPVDIRSTSIALAVAVTFRSLPPDPPPPRT